MNEDVKVVVFTDAVSKIKPKYKAIILRRITGGGISITRGVIEI